MDQGIILLEFKMNYLIYFFFIIIKLI